MGTILTITKYTGIKFEFYSRSVKGCCLCRIKSEAPALYFYNPGGLLLAAFACAERRYSGGN
ncbi:MAG: hypothetical protein LBN71_02120 [Tannerella sp.]|nr:hypothetical protein [Tannerella sp.]